MSKFNRAGTRTAAFSPITTTGITGLTHEGAPGYGRDTKSELFLLAVSGFVAEDAFYEKADARVDRFKHLVVEAARLDPGWTAAFLRWLRSDGNMRTAPLVAAAELVRAKPDGMRTRAVVDSVLQRADEPSEILAYWLATYGKTIPIALKRGIADAIVRLYTERSFTKYDSTDRAVRMGDVIDLVNPAYHHPEIRGTWRYELFGHALDRRHGRDNPIPESLATLRARADLMKLPVADRRAVLLDPSGPDRLKAAGMTWEALAGWLQGPMDAKAWEAIIPSMGVFALARNLRNFDEAGVSDEVAEQVAAKLSDPETIAKSRMFPYRWWSAYQAAPSLRWSYPLEKALTLSTQNVPLFNGRTLILVDTSGSMSQQMSAKSTMRFDQAAALFGVALALRGSAVDLFGFADGTFSHPIARGGSVLKDVAAFTARNGEVGHGTMLGRAVQSTFRGHDRVIILSDMQTMDHLPQTLVPARVPIYAFNIGGYKHGAIPAGTGNRHELGGLTDATFTMIPALEAGRAARWPWATAA